jgi:penicillin-binding protein 1B
MKFPDPRRYFRWRWLRLAALLVLLALSVFALSLDFRVRSEFEGKRFALPARVYARALELFPGEHLSADELAQELARLHYRESAGETGGFQRRDAEFDVVTRPFTFWDGVQPSQALHLVFRDGRLDKLTGRDGAAVALARLDPPYIGGIYPARNEDRILVKLSEVPQDLIHGLIAVEDRKFYSHVGVDPRGLARAFVSTVTGHGMQGGSTLTQQLVKNFFLTPERTLRRKLTEMIMALLLELHYSKNEILETYVNEIYLGQDKNRAIHGFGLAAQFYFGKQLKDLTLPESALLVGMVKGPGLYEPHRHPDKAVERRNVALGLMREQGYITDE